MTAGRTDNIKCLHTSTKIRIYTCIQRPMEQHRQGERLSPYQQARQGPDTCLICFVGQKAVDHVHRNGVADGHVRSLDHAGQAAQQRP